MATDWAQARSGAWVVDGRLRSRRMTVPEGRSVPLRDAHSLTGTGSLSPAAASGAGTPVRSTHRR